MSEPLEQATARRPRRYVSVAEYAKEQGLSLSTARRRLDAMGVESMLCTGTTERTSPLFDRCFGPMPYRVRKYRLEG